MKSIRETQRGDDKWGDGSVEETAELRAPPRTEIASLQNSQGATNSTARKEYGERPHAEGRTLAREGTARTWVRQRLSRYRADDV